MVMCLIFEKATCCVAKTRASVRNELIPRLDNESYRPTCIEPVHARYGIKVTRTLHLSRNNLEALNIFSGLFFLIKCIECLCTVVTAVSNSVSNIKILANEININIYIILILRINRLISVIRVVI